MRFDLDGNGTVGFGDFIAFVNAFEQNPSFDPIPCREAGF